MKGYKRMVNIKEVKHTFSKHGNPFAENKRRQVAITIQDIENIPYLLENSEIIQHGLTPTGTIAIMHRIETETTIIYIEEVRTGRKKLALKTMWKLKQKPWLSY
ncbi:MAG: hypothetical protein IT223_04230 [Crocinitomicaceae bacterium]|nr:hypothetical protein [Crocinitomicaceae bacterium]